MLLGWMRTIADPVRSGRSGTAEMLVYDHSREADGFALGG
jgi:hypothetical protein